MTYRYVRKLDTNIGYRILGTRKIGAEYWVQETLVQRNIGKRKIWYREKMVQKNGYNRNFGTWKIEEVK